MEIYVLDANLFFNMEPGLGLGRDTESVVKAVTQIMLKSKGKAQFYMPPKVVEEFLSFFDDREQPFLKEFLASIVVKSPHLESIQLPATVFSRFVDDVRGRNYRALQVSEEELKKLASQMMGKEALPKKEFEMAMQPAVQNLRKRFRQATRVGFLDSVADLELILLAKELGGTLVTTDEGVLVWGRQLGVSEMEASVFGARFGHEG